MVAAAPGGLLWPRTRRLIVAVLACSALLPLAEGAAQELENPAGTLDVEGSTVPADTIVQAPPEPSGSFGPGIAWSWRGRINQRFEVDTNRGLRVNRNGTVYGSRTGVRTTVSARTKRTRIATTFGVTGITFAGTEESEDLTRIDPRLVVNLRYDGKRYDFRSRVDASVDSTSFTQVEDTGNTDVETQQITVNYDADLGFRIDKLNTLVLGIDGRLVDFVDDAEELNPNRSIRFTAGSLHRLNDLTSVRFTGALRYFSSDNNSSTRTQTLTFGGALTHNRTRRHRFGVSSGVTLVRRQAELNNLDQTDYFVGAVGGAGLDYQSGTINAGLDLLQRLEPTSAGELQTFTRLAGNLGYRLTPQQRISANVAVSRRDGLDEGSDQRTVIRFGPRYSINLSRRTSLNLGYTFRFSNDSSGADGSATGHRFFLAVSRGLTFRQ
ncbi:MAG: hypothetical protein AAFR17_00860 [Pseudomonadota bacterium]